MMRLVVLCSVVLTLAGCDEDESPPPAPLWAPEDGDTGVGPGATTAAASSSGGSDGTATADSTGGATRGAEGSSDGAGSSGGAVEDPCVPWANKWVECTDPTADAEMLALDCVALTSEAFLEFGPECGSAIGAVLECIVELDCPTFNAYDGGHGVIPAQCAAQQNAQDSLCM